MNNSKAESREKKPYMKPRLHCVELATDEVLGTGCKTPTGGGRDAPGQCDVVGCYSDIGS